MLDNKPLAVSQICWVSFCFHKDYVYHNLADSLYFSNNLLGKGAVSAKIGLRDSVISESAFILNVR